jgi:hypothetical protein
VRSPASMPTASSSTTSRRLSRMTPDGPTGSNEISARDSKTPTTSTSKSEPQKSDGSARDFLREWLSCRVGICPTKIATTRTRPAESAGLRSEDVESLDRSRPAPRRRRREIAREETNV